MASDVMCISKILTDKFQSNQEEYKNNPTWFWPASRPAAQDLNFTEVSFVQSDLIVN